MNDQSRPPRPPLNGVDTPALLGTINVVAGAPELAQFRFRADADWQGGTHTSTRISGFFGAGGDHEHSRAFTYDSDHPALLCGGGNGVSPPEFLLHALAGCLIAGIGNISAARGVKLDKVSAVIRGEMDIQGLLGLSDEVRNGFQKIDVEISIEGDAPREKLEAIVAKSKARSAVFDVLANGVPVNVSVA